MKVMVKQILVCFLCPTVYISTHFLTSQPTLIKLDNENIGGHLTPLHCLPHLHSTPPLGGFPSEYRHPVWHGETRMAWLPDGEKNSKISLFVLAQLTNVTDEQTQDTQTDTA